MHPCFKECLLADFFRVFTAPSNVMSEAENSLRVASHQLFESSYISSLRGVYEINIRSQMCAEFILIGLRTATGHGGAAGSGPWADH
jgi:hypothetical protein